jgi:hypothetical protein
MDDMQNDFGDMVETGNKKQIMFQTMDLEKFCDIVGKACEQARVYGETELNQDRIRAMQYYDGEVPDLTVTPNRSTMVSNDSRAVLYKVKPAIMRTFFGGSRVVDFVVDEVDGETEIETDQREEMLEQVTEKINEDFMNKGGYLSLESAIDDALINDEGILKYSFRPDCIEFTAVPPEQLLITPDARGWAGECSLLGSWSRTTRSDLIAEGFSFAVVQEAPEAGNIRSLEDNQRFNDKAGITATNTEIDLGEQSEEVEAFEVFARIDFDGDGIAELRHIIFVDKCEPENLLKNEPVARARLFGVRCENRPHSWRGRALVRDIMDIQKAKTALLRAAMDNMSAINDPTTVIDLTNVINPDDITQRKRGAFVLIEGGKAMDVLHTIQIPETATGCFEAMKYYDAMLVDRVGVSGAANGMLPEVLQGQTATAVNMIQSGGTARVELICRNIAEGGLRPMFEAVFLDAVEMMGIPLTLKGTSVNVGLGSGTKERDMAALVNVLTIQKEIMINMGQNNLFVQPKHLSNTLEKLVEVSGLRTPETYFNKPSDDDIAQHEQAKGQAPDPEQMKLQAQAALEDKKMQSQAMKEREQAAADIQVKQIEAEKDQLKAQLDQMSADRAHQEKMQLEQMKLEHDAQMTREKMQHDMVMHGLKSGDVAIDPATGAQKPTKHDDMMQLMQVLLQGMAQTQAMLSAPRVTKLIRDETTGRSVGAVQTLENGMVQ